MNLLPLGRSKQCFCHQNSNLDENVSIHSPSVFDVLDSFMYWFVVQTLRKVHISLSRLIGVLVVRKKVQLHTVSRLKAIQTLKLSIIFPEQDKVILRLKSYLHNWWVTGCFFMCVFFLFFFPIDNWIKTNSEQQKDVMECLTNNVSIFHGQRQNEMMHRMHDFFYCQS